MVFTNIKWPNDCRMFYVLLLHCIRSALGKQWYQKQYWLLFILCIGGNAVSVVHTVSYLIFITNQWGLTQLSELVWPGPSVEVQNGRLREACSQVNVISQICTGCGFLEDLRNLVISFSNTGTNYNRTDVGHAD